MPATKQPGSGLWAAWSLGESQWKDQMDANLRFLSVAVQPALEVISGALPETADEGALAWDEEEGKLVFFDGSAWQQCPVQPQRGWQMFDKGGGKVVLFDGSGFIVAAGIEDAPFDGRYYVRKNGQWVRNDYHISSYIPQITAGNQELAAFILPLPMTLGDGAAGCLAKVSVASPNNIVLSLRRNGVEIGTLEFEQGEEDGVFEVDGDVEFDEHDELSVVSPNTISGSPEGIKLLFRLKM